MRRNVTAVMPALLMAALVGGCSAHSGHSSSPAPSPAPSVAVSGSARDIVAASVPSAAHGSYQFAEKGPAATSSGTVEPSHRRFLVKVDTPVDAGASVHMEFLGVDPQVWVKTSLPGASKEMLAQVPKVPASWMHLDKAKIGDSAAQIFRFGTADATDVSALMEGLVSAAPAGPDRYSGTVDLTKAANQTTVADDTITALAGKAKAVPFTATLDEKGRILTLTMPIPAAGQAAASTYTVSFFNYGTAPALSAPSPAERIEAPEAEYRYFNGGE